MSEVPLSDVLEGDERERVSEVSLARRAIEAPDPTPRIPNPPWR